MDVLQGDLDAFPLDDVVRLLAGRRATGVLRVECGSLTGRVFLIEGGLSYATTRDGDGSVAALSRLTDGPDHDRRGRNPGGRWPDPARPLILQQISEVLIRLGHSGAGRFWFVEGVRTRAYGSDEIQRFDVEDVLEAVETRRADWAQIAGVLPVGSGRFFIRPHLGPADREVTIGAPAWSALAAVGGGASIQDVAERLNLFELTAAGLLADLYSRGLIVVDPSEATTATVLLEMEADSA